MSIKTFLLQRLQSTPVVESAAVLKPAMMLASLQSSNRSSFVSEYGKPEIVALQKTIMTDLDAVTINTDWIEIKSIAADLHENGFLAEETLLTFFQKLCTHKNAGMVALTDALTLMARVTATAPHSMFVEQAISCYDLIKDDDRASLSRSTINDYMTVKVNMPTVSQFDIRKALAVWTRRDHRARV